MRRNRLSSSSALLLVACYLSLGAVQGTTGSSKVGVFWPAPDAVQSSSACASVIYFQGSQDPGTNLTKMPGGQLFDHSRPILYSSRLHGCVQCARDRFFDPPLVDTAFFAPAHCRRCPEGEMQDETGMGSVAITRRLGGAHDYSCSPPLIQDAWGDCICPLYTRRIPGSDYCECIDRVARTEYDPHSYQVSCNCPTGTEFSLGQCLCPVPNQVYDDSLGRCVGCPPNQVVVDGCCVCDGKAGKNFAQDLKVCEDRWFRSTDDLQGYLATQLGVHAPDICVSNIRGTCEKTLVDVSVPGVCGDHTNTTLSVQYAPRCPDVSASTTVKMLDMRKPGLYDVGFSFQASDDCGLVPEATVLTVFSNQMHLCTTSTQVRVQPIYDCVGGLINFQVFLRARVFTKCDAAMGKLCRDDNHPHRTYTLRLCVTNKAGCTACSETEVSVVKSAYKDAYKNHQPLSRIVAPKVKYLSGTTISSGLFTSIAAKSALGGATLTSNGGGSGDENYSSSNEGNYILGTFSASG